MGKGRWLYDNFINSAEMVSLSSARSGQVGRVVPQALGGATLWAQGGYRGDDDRKYEIRIDDIANGPNIEQATFAWRSNQDDGWRQQHQPTSTVPRELEHGVMIKWNASQGDDFVKGDRWTFLAMRLNGRAALVADDPDRQWRAAGCALETISVDLGQTQLVGAMVLGHHNLSDQAQAILLGHHADDWSAPTLVQVLNLTQPHLVCFPGASLRFWRLELRDPTNPEGVLRASQFFLGRYLEPGLNYIYGSERSTIYNRNETTSAGNLTGASQAGQAESLRLAYRSLREEDVRDLRGLMDSVHQGASGKVRPLWLCPDVDQGSDLIFGLPSAELRRRMVRPGTRSYEVTINFEEIARRQP